MIKKTMLFGVLLLSGFAYAECPQQCPTECDRSVECDVSCECGDYRMRATLYMDGTELDVKEGPTKGGSILFADYGVQVIVVEEREDGLVVRVDITNEECPMSCKSECKALPVEEDASSESCDDQCLRHIPWGQEIIVSCTGCKYSMHIVVEKSE